MSGRAQAGDENVGRGAAPPHAAASAPAPAPEPAPAREPQPDTRESDPALRFEAASIGVCLLLHHAGAPADAVADNAFTYHQHDFLSYAYRDDPPLRLAPRSSSGLEDLARLMCTFPGVEYAVAGARRTMPPAAAQHEVTVDVACASFRPSGLSVLVVLLGLADAVNEFGVIRLAKLWEGGEETPHLLIGEDGVLRLSGDPWVSFHRANGGTLNFAQLIEGVRGHCCPDAGYVARPQPGPPRSSVRQSRPYVTGTVQLQTDEGTLGELVLGLRQAQERSGAVRSAPWPRELFALSGILRALMAFDDTYPQELPSIFRETIVEGGLITAVHKGTFLRVAHEMRMPSAYFILPHCIALHNEALLDRAVTAGHDRLAANVRPRERRRFTSWRGLDATRRALDEDLDRRLDAAVIHYPNLRELYERAAVSRGLVGLAARAQRYAEELRVEANTTRASVQAWAQAVFAALAVIVAIVVGLLQIPGGSSSRPPASNSTGSHYSHK